MIIAILVILLAFGWLLYETEGLTVRLIAGKLQPPKYARYTAYNSLKKRKTWDMYHLKDGGNLPEDYIPNGEPNYTIVLSPGIDNVLCGWDWLNKHCAAMVDYIPSVYLHIGGVRYNMSIKDTSIFKDVMRTVKLTKRQVRAYAAQAI